MQRLLIGCFASYLVLLMACGPKPPPPAEKPELSTAERVRMARSYLKAGRSNEALLALDAAIAADPDNPVIYHNRGLVCVEAGQLAAAAESFEKVLELDPSYTDAHNFLGVIYTELERPMDAERHLRAALDDPVYPTPEKVYLNLGVMYRTQGRTEEALHEIRRAVEIDPKYYQGHFELASTLDMMGKLSEAAREYEVAAPGYQSSGDYFFRLGLAYFRLGDKPMARENLERVIEISPGSANSARADELLELMN